MPNRPTYMPDRSGLTGEVFDAYLAQLLEPMRGDWCLAIPGVSELVGEYMNNAVIEAWDNDHPAEARPRVYGRSDRIGFYYNYTTDGEELDDDELLALAAEAERVAADAMRQKVYSGGLTCELLDGRPFVGWWKSGRN